MDRMRIITKVKREDIFVKDVHSEAEYVASDKQTYYTRGCKFTFLGMAFALSGLLCWAGISQVVANSVTSAFKNAFGIPQIATTIVLVAASACIVLRKNATVKVLDRVVPVMACAYFAMTLLIIFKNISYMPVVLSNNFGQAFGIKPIVGGGLGAVVMNGVKRGLFSNEAGSGSAPCAAAAAEVSHPVKQGLIQALGVLGVGLMTIFNMIAIIPLSGQVMAALKDYEENYKGKQAHEPEPGQTLSEETA